MYTFQTAFATLLHANMRMLVGKELGFIDDPLGAGFQAGPTGFAQPWFEDDEVGVSMASEWEVG
jgi:hypothetical protein